MVTFEFPDLFTIVTTHYTYYTTNILYIFFFYIVPEGTYYIEKLQLVFRFLSYDE